MILRKAKFTYSKRLVPNNLKIYISCEQYIKILGIFISYNNKTI